MRNSVLTLLACLTALPLLACGDSGGDALGTRAPYRDSWRVEGETDFIHTAPDADGNLVTQIGNLRIGGREFNDNFANRGDVVVNFDGPADRIMVEFRRFSTNTSEDAAQLDFDAMSLWAFNTSVGSPSKPNDMDPEADCTGSDGWLPDCGIRLYYDGQKQLARAGADIRITLPSDYRQSLDIVTEDADEDSDYINRGNVCVFGTNGSVDVDMQSGEAFVSISDEATPAPTCGAPPNTKSNPSANVEFCNDLEIDGVPSAWSDEQCACAMEGVYGVVKVESDDSAAANITVDVPTGLWSAITVENKGDAPESCTGTISVPGLVPDESGGNEFAWEARGTVNSPSDAVTAGAGYNIQARSGQCDPVSFTEDPANFVGKNNGSMQESEQRGNTEVCDGCLRTSSCDALMP